MDPHADKLRLQVDHLREETMLQLDTWGTVYLAHHPKRPEAVSCIRALFPDLMKLHGDHHYGDDMICQGDIAIFRGRSVAVLAQSKGETLEENMQHNFEMLHPEDYHKVVRLTKQTEKFHRPIITLASTAGTYPGKNAEERGRVEVIAQCLAVFSEIRAPVLAIVLSKGGSGGTLASSVADHVIMLEYAIYSILSLEGFVNILWKDESRMAEAAGMTELTATGLRRKGIIDMIIIEPRDGTYICFNYTVEHLWEQLEGALDGLYGKEGRVLLARWYGKYRMVGANYEEL